jgi:RNA recognition motif.
VKNIPWSVTWQQLKDAFREFGSITRADIPQDRKVENLLNKSNL